MSEDRDDYLWDGSGAPDPAVAKLEEMADGLGWKPGLRLVHRPRRRRRAMWIGVATAALAAAAGFWLYLRARPTAPIGPSWSVADLAGAPACGDHACEQGLRVGDWLETDSSSRARVAVADIGFLEVAPDTRLRLKTTSAHEHRLELARGTISAHVSAPPRLLIVETPTANAVDLGCAYTLTVQPDGSSLLTVTSGWVGLEVAAGRSAYIPAGSVAETRPGKGVGTPRRADASPELVAALRAIDYGAHGAAEMQTLLSTVRLVDTISLWHVLWRLGPDERGALYERMVSLEGEVPEGVTRDKIVALDEAAMSSWREDLKDRW